jgi:hypothetical protein
MQSLGTKFFLILFLQASLPAVCIKPARQPSWNFVASEHRGVLTGKPVSRPAADSSTSPTKEKCSTKDSYKVDSSSFKQTPEYNNFLPKCIDHLRGLVKAVDGSYTDLQLETVLEHNCEYETKFPLTYEDGFEKNSHCRKFACQLVSARDAELKRGGWVEAYNTACESYWSWQHKKPESMKAPVFTEETMPAVSTTLSCIIGLTLQYFGLYTALVIVRTMNSLGIRAYRYDNLQRILEAGCTTVSYAPMLCILFLGTRMRAIQLSQGQTEKYSLPQPWVQTSMVVASWSIVAQTLLVVIVAVMTKGLNVATDKEGHLDMNALSESANPTALKVLSSLRYVVMAMLYGGFTAVVVGVFMMKGPKKIWGNEQLPVSPAVMCTILLSGLFFLVYLLVAVTRTCFELSQGLRSSRLLHALASGSTQAKMTVNLAPMLCILFIGARMRALQIDPKNGNPQSWAQKCFFMCTFSVLIQTILVIILPFVAKGRSMPEQSQGEIVYAMENKKVGLVLTVVRYLCLLALYGGAAAVVYSIFTIRHPEGAEETPPVSPAMQCVINLAAQYFFIYIVLSVCITFKSFSMSTGLETNDAEQPEPDLRESPFTKIMTKAIVIFEAAKGTVMFAPMLAVLFIGARMRALQLTRAKDGTISPQAGPQPWVQDAMFLATWAVFVQLVMAIAVPILSGAEKTDVDADGNVKVPQSTHKGLVIVAEVVRYLSLLCMYGGSMIVVFGIYTMTPNALPPHSKQNLVPGVEVPKPAAVPVSSHSF